MEIVPAPFFSVFSVFGDFRSLRFSPSPPLGGDGETERSGEL